MLTDKDVQEIRERAAKATPGPWEADRKNGESTHWFDVETVREDDASEEEITSLAELHIRWVHPDYVELAKARYLQCEINADFIAHARTDVPSLCDTVDELRRELAEAKSVIEAAQEEMRLIRMKDCDRVYDPTLKARMHMWLSGRAAKEQSNA